MLAPRGSERARMGLFNLVKTANCVVVGEYCTIQFHMRGGSRELIVNMVTKNKDACLYIVKNTCNQVLSTLNLSVERYGADGHMLAMKGTVYKEECMVEWNAQIQALIASLIMYQHTSQYLSFVDNTVVLSRLDGPLLMMFGNFEEDKNLRQYRDIVRQS